MAQNNGKRFEKNIKDSCEKQGILWERYKDNGKFGYSENTTMTRFSSENPCDGHIYYKNRLVYIELKTAMTGSISFNQPPTIQRKGEIKPSIKAHQVNALILRSSYVGVSSGLLVEFSDRQTKTKLIEGGCFYINIHKFYQWAMSVNKKSINVDDARLIGTEVESKRLKVNSRYNIQKLLEDIVRVKECENDTNT